MSMARSDRVTFSKPPLELLAAQQRGTARFRMIGAFI
jgi:hypothetical protein